MSNFYISPPSSPTSSNSSSAQSAHYRSRYLFTAGGVWLTSRGNQEQVKKGKDAFTYALIGLAVVFGSYAILNLIITALTG